MNNNLFSISLTFSLIIISFLVCIKTGNAQSADQNWAPNFHSVNSSVYEVNLQYKENGVSGLVVIKSDSKDKFHLVFMTQFGLKLMEFIIEDEKLEVIQIIEWLDRKILLNVIERDFNIMLFPHISNNSMSKATSSDFVIKSKPYKHSFSNQDGNLFIQKSMKRKRISVNYSNYESKIPRDISIQHKIIKLRMDFKLIQLNEN